MITNIFVWTLYIFPCDTVTDTDTDTGPKTVPLNIAEGASILDGCRQLQLIDEDLRSRGRELLFAFGSHVDEDITDLGSVTVSVSHGILYKVEFCQFSGRVKIRSLD